MKTCDGQALLRCLERRGLSGKKLEGKEILEFRGKQTDLFCLDTPSDSIIQHPPIRPTILAPTRHPNPVLPLRRLGIHRHMRPPIRNTKQRCRRPPQLHERPLALVIARRHDAKIFPLGFTTERFSKNALVLRGFDQSPEGSIAGGGGVCAVGGVEECDAAWL